MSVFENLRGWRVAGMRKRAAARARALVLVPPARWPLAWHIAAALASVLIAAGAGHMWRNALLDDHRRASADLQLANTELARQQRQRPSIDPVVPLAAEAGIVDAVVRDMGQFGSAKAVQVASVRIEQDADRTAAAQHVRLIVQASGDYTALKSWLAELLARYPALAISSIQLRRGAPDQPRLEAAVTLSLFTKAMQ